MTRCWVGLDWLKDRICGGDCFIGDIGVAEAA